jgi:hypothetical protein
MFISVIIDGYNASNDEEKMHINEDTMDTFTQIFMKHDPTATGLIEIDKF